MSATGHARGFTVVELMLAMGIVMILAALGSTSYRAYQEKVRIAGALTDIQEISLRIAAGQSEGFGPPATLDGVGWGNKEDPWGNPYEYAAVGTVPAGKLRKDRFLVPINSDYDLYSKGPDGKSVPPITAKDSQDDIIRANDGGFFGVASAF